MPIKTNLKISKVLFWFSILFFLISFLFFYFFPSFIIIEKFVDISLTSIIVSIALVVYFGNQRDILS